MSSAWWKYWYVCTRCDASIEIASKRKPKVEPTCNCGGTNVILCHTGIRIQDDEVTNV